MLVANVIFHAFQAAYFSWIILAPLALGVLIAEGAILRAFNSSVSFKAIVACVLVMNIASYVIGTWLSPRLYVGSGLVVVNPDEHGYGILDRGPQWQRLARYSFLQAGIVSAIIETVTLLPVRKRAGLRHIVMPVVLGNCLSYSLLSLGFVWMFGGWSYHASS
ncbi:hypothetical protein [Singulisphaera acidiphila]|uniref:Uncharacterized protein n=1 Tax=Singulisphaera acidiphila (strain ATCC BAA-1392 / DSM 18658 / VKM B-2454 / MOB10) TaxID=886293 RepID=L0DHJ3_SINAD|nr:hypothetical protein [Singulisphaera acidiphila]AGA28320.1 hypothetical protein Sinac_4106 [Singulisphaera acidiphila DSM 18658]